MILETIEYYLRANGILGTIYKGFLPPTPDTAIVLTPTAAGAPDAKHNYNQIGLQVRTRSATYPTAEALCYAVYNTLQSAGNRTISGVYVVDVQAQQDPYSLGRDENDRHHFVQNFVIDYYRDIGNRRD